MRITLSVFLALTLTAPAALARQDLSALVGQGLDEAGIKNQLKPGDEITVQVHHCNETGDSVNCEQTRSTVVKVISNEGKTQVATEKGAVVELPDSPSAVKTREAQAKVPAATGPKADSRSKQEGFHWGPAAGEYLMLMGIENGYRLGAEKKTRDQAFKGPYFKKWADGVAGISDLKWSDGGKFFTNYVAHPMGGSVYGMIEKQNDPKAKNLEFDVHSPEYRKHVLHAFEFSAGASTCFEFCPVISEAAIGGVGSEKNAKGNNGQGFVDLVMTPVGGTAWMVGEDAADKYIIKRFETGDHSKATKVIVRMVFNPTRDLSNVLRFKAPWYRDNRALTPSAAAASSGSAH